MLLLFTNADADDDGDGDGDGDSVKHDEDDDDDAHDPCFRSRYGGQQNSRSPSSPAYRTLKYSVSIPAPTRTALLGS